jgi:hypothetical protein
MPSISDSIGARVDAALANRPADEREQWRKAFLRFVEALVDAGLDGHDLGTVQVRPLSSFSTLEEFEWWTEEALTPLR